MSTPSSEEVAFPPPSRSVVIVTGGANGIGKAIVEKLVVAGHQVVFMDLDKEAGAALEAKIGEDNCKFVPADVTNEDDWAKAVDTALNRFGRIDGLVNNAGIKGPRNDDPAVLDHKEMMHTINVHVGGAQLGIKAVMPHFDKENGGVVLNTSSQASGASTAGAGLMTSYAIAKAGLDMLTRAVVTCHPTVRCYSFNPSFIDTALARSFNELPVAQALGLKTFEDTCFALNPLGKVGKTEAVADLYVNAFEGTNWKFNNGNSVGIIPNGDDGVYAYVFDQMLGQLSSPSPWMYEPMLNESFQFCDQFGNPLSEEEARKLRAALTAHKEEVVKFFTAQAQAKGN